MLFLIVTNGIVVITAIRVAESTQSSLQEIGLGGGEKPRPSTPRPICTNAQAIIVDEPAASLDDEDHANVIERFASRARDERTIVAATQDTGMIHACNAQHSRRQVTLTAVALAGPAVGRALRPRHSGVADLNDRGEHNVKGPPLNRVLVFLLCVLAVVVLAIFGMGVFSSVNPLYRGRDSARPPCEQLSDQQAVSDALATHQDLARRILAVGPGVRVDVATPCEDQMRLAVTL